MSGLPVLLRSVANETMNMIRKGQVRWIAKDDIAGQVMFVENILGLTTR
jgi:hypothetical protein